MLKLLLTLMALCIALPAAGRSARAARALHRADRRLQHLPYRALRMLGGNVPESDWLPGDKVGWRGVWGTTYATNLRIYMQTMSEEQWVQKGRTFTSRPPMPWFAIQAMTDEDLRALYRYVRSLGAAGKPAPSYVMPLVTPRGPYVQFPYLPVF
jgi:hypothetical protein